MQQDPILFKAGDPNVGRYCGNNTTNGTDLSGLLDRDAKKRYIAAAKVSAVPDGWTVHHDYKQTISDKISTVPQVTAFWKGKGVGVKNKSPAWNEAKYLFAVPAKINNLHERLLSDWLKNRVKKSIATVTKDEMDNFNKAFKKLFGEFMITKDDDFKTYQKKQDDWEVELYGKLRRDATMEAIVGAEAVWTRKYRDQSKALIRAYTEFEKAPPKKKK